MPPLPFLKTKLLPLRKKDVNKSKIEKSIKQKPLVITGDNLKTPKLTRIKRKNLPKILPKVICDCTLMHLSKIIISYAPRSRKRGASNIVLSMTTWGATGQTKRIKLPNVANKIVKKLKSERNLVYDSDDFFRKLENQLKALNIGKGKPKPAKGAAPASQRSKEREANDESDGGLNSMMDDAASGESRRRGKRRRKGRGAGGSDRMTSAGLAARAHQDPETQIAGITSDSHNASSRGSVAGPIIDDVIAAVPPTRARPTTRPKTDSFLDEDILKLLHRDVDEEAIENEFDAKRRYVLEEALRTRPPRASGEEMQTLLKELNVPAVSLGDWLHIPRVFSRQNAQFTLPLDSKSLMSLSPMQYTARFVTLKKSKQLLYLSVLRKFRQIGYRMPIKDISEGLYLMMGGILTKQQVLDFQVIMEWERYEEEEVVPDEIKLTLSESGYRRPGCYRPGSNGGGDTYEPEEKTIKYRTWCGLCAVCERMYGKFPPRNKDPPDGMELSDFTMIETKLATLQVHKGLAEILNAIRTR